MEEILANYKAVAGIQAVTDIKSLSYIQKLIHKHE